MTEFLLNDELINSDKPSGSLLLDLVRYDKQLTGTKIGCREGDCGACTVLIGTLSDGRIHYEQVTSCLTPLGNVQGKHVVTVEGLNMKELSPAQQCMVDESGTQCGFCTVGFVVSLTGFCLAANAPTYEDAIIAIDGNICRCTGYKSIERAAMELTKALKNKDTKDPVPWLVENEFIPAYFNEIPARLKEIVSIPVTNSHAILVGGGTDLYVQRPDDLVVQEVGHVAAHPELRSITVKNGVCTIGGGSTVTDLVTSKPFQEHFPALWKHMKLVSSSPIRNISTVAGNFVNASPIGDLTAFFIALNASIELSHGGEKRTILLKDLYKGYKDLDKKKEEMISAVSFNVPSPWTHFNFEKVSKRIHLDIASVNSAAQIATKDKVIDFAHISAGGVGPTPKYLKNTCEFLRGKEMTGANIKAAYEVLQEEISPISDVRGTAEYKRLLLRQLFFAHFVVLFPERISLKELL